MKKSLARPSLLETEAEVDISPDLKTACIKAITSYNLYEFNQCINKDKRLLTAILDDKHTAIEIASQANTLNIVWFILESLQNTNNIFKLPSNLSDTLFYKALKKQNIPNLDLLLLFGININQSLDDAGNTALHFVANHHLPISAHWLLTRNADSTKLNNSMCTALDVAVASKNIKVAALLSTNQTKLNVCSSIKYSNVEALAIVLKANLNLHSFDLNNNKITDNDANDLSQALTTNTSLRRLNLSNNKISINGATALSQALATNTSLYSLNLNDNYLDNSGIQAFAMMLKINTTLRSLYLWNTLQRN